MDTCIHLMGVGGNTDFGQEVEVVYFCSPWVVLFVCLYLSVGPEAAVNAYFSACPGSVHSSFSGFGANLVSEFVGFTHLSLLCWQCLRSHYLKLKWLWVQMHNSGMCVAGSYSGSNELFIPCSRILCDHSFHI